MAGAAVAVMVRRARQDILRHFIGQGATNPQQAVAYDPDLDGWKGARIRRRLFRRMRDFGAIMEPQAGKFYLDEDRAEAFRWEQRKRAMGLAAIATGVVAAIAALA